MIELKQRVVASSSKLRRHEVRRDQYVQHRMFQANQVKLFERMEKEKRSNDIRPGSQGSLRFWDIICNAISRIWIQLPFFIHPTLAIRDKLEMKQPENLPDKLPLQLGYRGCNEPPCGVQAKPYETSRQFFFGHTAF